MMERRSFLRILGAVPVVAVAGIPKLPIPAAIESGFGLAPIKAEGSAIVYDGILHGTFPKALWPGIEKFYAKFVEDFPDFDFKEFI